MGWFNDLITTGTGGVYSPDHGFSAPGVGIYTNTSYGQKASKEVTGEDFKSLIPGIGDKQAQDEANRVNILLNRENRDWQERMSNSAYQRGMDDMRKAGLNPMLAYAQGGASTPSNQAAQVGAASASGFGQAIGQIAGFGINTAQRNIQLNQQQAMNESTIKLQETQAAQNAANTAKAIEQTKTESFTGNMAKKAEGTIDRLINYVDSTAKKTKDRQSWWDKIKSITNANPVAPRGKHGVTKVPFKLKPSGGKL